MNILVIGSGAREHTLVKTIKKSPLCGKIYASPSNAGIDQDAINANISGDFAEITSFCKSNNIEFVVVGPEQPLVDGLVDYLQDNNILAFGANKAAAFIEGSKEFMKDCVAKYNIPTAKYASFTDADSAKEYIQNHPIPIVVKTDGLAAGKGVIIAESLADAEQAIDEMFDGKFGEAGQKIVIEEFLEGEEASFFAICDGSQAIAIGSAQDHKRIGNGDTGLNTGGMGTYSPAPVVTKDIHQQIMDKTITPLIEGLKSDGIEYKGFLFAGLMIKDGQVKLLEYNVRFGDPEAQVVLPLVENDILELMLNAARGELGNAQVNLADKASVCVVMASDGYPESYQKGTVIESLGKQEDNITIYHAGTAIQNGELTAIGGRVLGVTAISDSILQAQQDAYKAVDKVKWSNGYFRNDIAWRAV